MFNSPHVKRKLISSITDFVYKLPHELLNESRLRMLGKLKILEKSQNWVGASTLPSRSNTLAIAVKITQKQKSKVFALV